MSQNIVNPSRDSAVVFEFRDANEISEEPRTSTSGGFSSNILEDERAEKNYPNTPLTFFLHCQKFFNVQTDDVLLRIKGALLPNPKSNYFLENIKTNPDLYGPFWICVTLALTIAISSNIVDYLRSSESDKHIWKYDFHIISKATFIIFLYAWMVPVMLWSIVKWYLAYEINLHLLELICVYGYCISVFVPVAVLWILTVPYLQWSLMIVGTVLSGLVLISSVYPFFGNKNYSLLGGLTLLHICFSAVIFFNFFH